MRVLIIGGTGTISTPIVEAMAKASYQLSVLNRGNSQLPAGVEQLIADRNDIEAMTSVLSGRSFDVTIDMVCFTSSQLEALTQVLPKHGQIILCSTVCALGFDQWTEWPVVEDAAFKPNSDYGRGKAEAETWLKNYSAKNKTPYTIIRPSTTFDEGIGVLRQICWDGSKWLSGLRNNAPIVIADGGMGMNQFMHAKDCGRAFFLCAGNEACFGQTFQVVGPATSWLEHHKTAAACLGVSGTFINAPHQAVLVALPDNGIFKEIFQYHGVFSSRAIFDCIGFEPELSLHDAISSTITEMDKQEKIPGSYQAEDWELQLIEQFS